MICHIGKCAETRVKAPSKSKHKTGWSKLMPQSVLVFDPRTEVIIIATLVIVILVTVIFVAVYCSRVILRCSRNRAAPGAGGEAGRTTRQSGGQPAGNGGGTGAGGGGTQTPTAVHEPPAHPAPPVKSILKKPAGTNQDHYHYQNAPQGQMV